MSNSINLPFKQILPGRFLNLSQVVMFHVTPELDDSEKKQPTGRWLLIVEILKPGPPLIFAFDREHDAYSAIGYNRSQLAMFS